MINIVSILSSLIILFTSIFSFAVYENNHTSYNSLPYREGRILVKTTLNAPLDAALETAYSLGAMPIMEFSLVPGLALYEYHESIDIDEAVEAFLSNEYVEYAEPDYVYNAAVQNDPLFVQQWALENIGQTGGTLDADINANSMWALEDGDQNVVIGIIDTGIDYTHSDLIPNLWHNTLEIAGNGVDDDGNGYVDDLRGANTVANNGDPFDDNAHGTHVAGTIGADGNNLIGVVGVSQNVQIAACKFLGANGSGSTSGAIQCLQYFAALKTRSVNPVNIVATNNSWGSSSMSTPLRDAILAHQNLGILFVAAAGNSSSNNDTTSNYPSNYDLSNVIAVAATDHTDSLASFSSFGKKTVHVAAPGTRILSSVPNQGYALFSGTSMATPHVTGLIAIIKSAFPSFDYKQIKNLVLSSGTPLAALQSNTITGRRIRGADNNGTGALSCNNQIVNTRLRPFLDQASLTLGGTLFLSAVRLNCDAPLGALTLYTDANESIILQDNGSNGDAVANDGIYSLSWQPLKAQTYGLNFGNGDIVTVTVTGGTAPPPLKYQPTTVTFEYETITGTSLAMGDESVVSIVLPFSIPFNGGTTAFNRLYVSSNGTMSFSNSANPGFTNKTLPVSGFSTLIAPYWDDLIPVNNNANSNVFAASVGTAPHRRLIVEWRGMRQYDTNGTGTFQAIFYEDSSNIRFNYLDTNFNVTGYNSGRSATVGVQTSADAASLFGFNVANVPSQFSLLFRLQ